MIAYIRLLVWLLVWLLVLMRHANFGRLSRFLTFDNRVPRN
jgi:hypothetical protein